MKKKLLIVILILVLIPVVLYFGFPQVLYNFSINSVRKAAGLSKKVIQVDKYSIHYLEGGKGESVLLLHGFNADKDNWSKFSESLVENYHIVAIDLPGFGESSKIEGELYDIASQAKRVNSIVEVLGLKKFHIAGNSMGGAISGKLAVDYPEKVLSLALLNTAGIPSAQKSEFAQLVENGDNLLSIKTPEDFQRMLGFVFVEPPPIPSRILDYLTRQSIKNRDFSDKIFKQIIKEEYSLERDLAKVKVKTMVIWGDKDRILHVSATDVIKKELPDSKVVVLTNCGHLPMIERPAETAKHYLKFLSKSSNLLKN
ncbi:MAG: alpha/beta fold hydrolase [Desulfobacteraceae bacterium]|nr:alpha/beta fold hydrolase [Desulfobacteraceae bacterium]